MTTSAGTVTYVPLSANRQPRKVVPEGWTRAEYRKVARRVSKMRDAVLAGKMTRDEFADAVVAMGLRVKEAT